MSSLFDKLPLDSTDSVLHQYECSKDSLTAVIADEECLLLKISFYLTEYIFNSGSYI